MERGKGFDLVSLLLSVRVAFMIQCAVGSKILGRERLAPFRKDVLTKSGKTVGGGDVTRKMKLLNRQKEQKKNARARSIGNIEVSNEAFMSVMKAQSRDGKN